jgi:hypothetical protein
MWAACFLYTPGRVRTPAPPALLLLGTTPPLHNNVFADSLQPDLKNNAKTVQFGVNGFSIPMHNARVEHNTQSALCTKPANKPLLARAKGESSSINVQSTIANTSSSFRPIYRQVHSHPPFIRRYFHSFTSPPVISHGHLSNTRLLVLEACSALILGGSIACAIIFPGPILLEAAHLRDRRCVHCPWRQPPLAFADRTRSTTAQYIGWQHLERRRSGNPMSV